MLDTNNHTTEPPPPVAPAPPPSLHERLADLEAEHRALFNHIRATDQWHRCIALEAQIALLKELLAGQAEEDVKRY